MDKKLLVSLMITTPIAAFAQGDWTVDNGNLVRNFTPTGSNWIPEGTVDASKWAADAQVKGGYLMASVASTYMESAALNLAEGLYTFDFSNAPLKNAHIELTYGTTTVDMQIYNSKGEVVGHKSSWALYDEETGEQLPISGALVIKVVQDKKGEEFGIGGDGVKMTLDYNMRRAVSKITSGYSGIAALEALPTNGPQAEITKLKTEREGLAKQLNASQKGSVAEAVGDLQTYWSAATASGESKAKDEAIFNLFNIYGQNNFYGYNPYEGTDLDNEKNMLPLGVSALEKKVNAYNTKVNNFNDNVGAKASLESSYNNLKNQLETQLKGNLKDLTGNSTVFAPLGYADVNYDKEFKADKVLQAFCAWYVDDAKTKLTNDLEAFKTAIATAYADANLTKTIGPNKSDEVEFKYDAGDLSDMIANIDYKGAIDDWFAYKYFGEKAAQVKIAMGEAFAAINNDLYKTYKDPRAPFTQLVYLGLINKYVDDLNEIYDKNENYPIDLVGGLVNKNENIIGASVYFGDALVDADGRIADMKHLWEPGTKADPNNDAIGNVVANLQAQYAIANTEVVNDQSILAGMKSVITDDMFATAEENDPEGAQAVKDAVSEYDKAVKRLDNYVYEQYMANTINATELYDPTDPESFTYYGWLVNRVKEAKAEYDKAIALLGNGAIKLLSDLEETYAEIKADANKPATKTESSVAGYDLPKKLEPSHDNIKANIDTLLGLDPDEYASTAAFDAAVAAMQTTIETAIKQLKNSGDALISTFRTAQTSLDAAQAALNAYNDAANKKTYLDGVSENLKNIYKLGCSVDGKSVALTPAEIQAKFDGYSANLKEYASNEGDYATPLLAMDAVKDLDATLTASNWVTNIDNSKGYYSKYVSDQNLNALKAYAAGIDNQIAEAEAVVDAAGKHIPGWPDKFSNTLDFSKAKNQDGKAYTGATSIDAAATDISTAGAITKVDDKIKALGTCDYDMTVIYAAYTAKYDQVKKAIDNWKAYTDLTKQLGDVNDKTIPDFITNVINATSPEAYATYIGAKSDGNGGLCKGFKEELARIQGLVNGSYTKVEEVANKATYDGLIKDLKDNIANALIACEKNEAAYQALIALDASVNAAANELIETIKEEDALASNVEAYLNKIKTEITDKAVEYNKEVRDFFAKGKAVDNQNDYTAKYNQLLTDLTTIKGEWSGGYSTAVDEANKALLIANGFDTDLATQYQEAVNWVNVYRQNITVGNHFYEMLMNDSQYKDNHEALKNMYVDVLDFTKRYQALMTFMTTGKPSEYVILENIYGFSPEDKSLTERESYALQEFYDLRDIVNQLATDIEDKVNAIDNAGVWEAEQYFSYWRNQVAWTDNLLGIISWLEDLGFSKDEVVDGKTVFGEASQACMKERITLNGTWTAFYDYKGAISEAEGEYDAALTAKNAAKDALDTAEAGVDDVEALQTAYDEALEAYVKAEDTLAAAKQAMILGMNNIANQVDPIAAIDVQQFVTTAVNNQWDNTYTKYTTDLKSWIEEIGSDYDYEWDKNRIQDYLNQMVRLNNEWNKLSNNQKTDRWYADPYFNQYYNTGVNILTGWGDNGPEYEYLLGLNPLYKNAYDQYYRYWGYGQQIVSEKVYAQLVGNVNSALNQAQAALDQKVEEFGYNQLVQNYQDMIDELTNEIQSYYRSLKESQLNADKFDLDTANYYDLSYMQRFIYLTQVIEGSSADMFAALQQYVGNDLVKTANSALNNAKVAGKITDAEFPAKAEEIDDIKTDVWVLEYLVVEDDIATQAAEEEEDVNAVEENAKSLKALKEYEAQLCALIAKYDEGTAFSSVADAKALLDPKFTDLSNQLNDFIEKIKSEGAETAPYGQDVIDEYLPQAEDLLSAFNSIKAAYDKSGSDVIADCDDFNYQLDRIQYNLDHSNWQETPVSGGLYDAWERAQAQASKFIASDKIADGILETINTLEVATATAHKEAEHYYHKDPRLNSYLSIMATINGQEEDKATGTQYVKSLRETVEEFKADHRYSETSDPTYWSVNQLTNDVNTYVRDDLSSAFDGACNAASEDIQALINGLLGNAGNENYWKYSYQNWEKIYEALDEEIANVKALQNTFPNPINWIASEDGSKLSYSEFNDVLGYWENKFTELLYVSTDAEEAIEAYQDLQTKLSAIDTKVNELKDEAEAGKYIKGDLDKDGDITIMDVQALIKMVGEGVDFDNDQDLKNRADVNSDDTVNVADITALINKMMNPGRPGRPAIVAAYNTNGSNNSFTIEEVEGENGIRRFAVVLSNEVAFAAGQIDIKVNGNGYVAGVSLADRAEELEAFVFDNSESTRVVMTSLENALIAGNNGSVLYIDVEGNGEVSVDNVIFSDLAGKAYDLSNSGSGVEGIYDSIKNGIKAIYNAAGQKLNNLTKGVNIIRNADGTTTKKVGK